MLPERQGRKILEEIFEGQGGMEMKIKKVECSDCGYEHEKEASYPMVI